jgi:hypothetical protein
LVINLKTLEDIHPRCLLSILTCAGNRATRRG